MYPAKQINQTFAPSGKRPMLLFYLIASGIPMLILTTMAFTPALWDWMYGHGRTFAYPEAGLDAARRLGYDQISTNLLERIPAALMEPVLWMPLVYAGAPTIAAIITISVMGNRGAFSTFLGRFHPLRSGTTITTALKYYGLLIALIFAARLVVYFVAGLHHIEWMGMVTATALYGFIVSAVFNQGGLLEECGWHTFATPYLQDHMSTPLAAAIVFGLLWSCWHIPRDLIQWDEGLLAFTVEYSLFTTGTISLSIIIAFLFNKLGGSVGPAIMFHGLVNQTFDMTEALEIANAYPEFLGKTVTKWALHAVFAFTAIILLKVCGRQLGLPAVKKSTSPT